MALVVLAVFGASMVKVYPSGDIYDRRGVGTVKVSKSNVPEVFRLCGFHTAFCTIQLVSGRKTGPDIRKTQVETLIEQDAQHYVQPKVQPNVLFLMCESYSDLSDADVFAYTEEDDPMHGFHVLAVRRVPGAVILP